VTLGILPLVARGLALISLVGLVACGDDHAAMTPDGGDGNGDDAGALDASAPDGSFGFDECWPTMEPRPTAGYAILGAGDVFTAMPGELPLAYGPQGGFMVFINVHMSGFAPGNPRSLLDPSNPRTRLQAFYADTNVPLTGAGCTREPYVPSPAGGFVFGASMPVIFNPCWRSDWLIGARIRIDMEIMDPATGAYASDSKIVNVTGSADAGYPIEEGTDPCPDPSLGPPPVTPLKHPMVEIRSR